MPGKSTDITLRYKDMVAVGDASARTAVFLRNVPCEPTGEQLAVAEALPSFTLAATLSTAARHVEAGYLAAATQVLATALAPNPDTSGRNNWKRLLSVRPGARTGEGTTCGQLAAT